MTIDWDGFEPGVEVFGPIYFDEMWATDHELVEANPDAVGPDVAATVAVADVFRSGADDARKALSEWRTRVGGLFERVQLLALPTLPVFPPRLDAVTEDSLLATIIEITHHVALFNAAGTPAPRSPSRSRGARSRRACSSSAHTAAKSSS